MFKIKSDKLRTKVYKSNLSSLLGKFSTVEVTLRETDLSKEFPFLRCIEYKPIKVKTLIQLETIEGEVLTIPLTKLCKIEISSEKTTIEGKSLDIFSES